MAVLLDGPAWAERGTVGELCVGGLGVALTAALAGK